VIDVVVVDDDYRVAAIHADFVRKVEGFRVVGTAHSAAQARTLIATAGPHLVLLDLYLPDEHGLDLLRSLVERAGDHPDVIVITAARDIGSVRTALQLGAVHYVVKPFGFALLRERLDAYRRMRSRLATLREASQEEVDSLLGLLRPPAPLPPKGHSMPTMALVRKALEESAEGMSAADVASAVGVSRPTAQRYLAQLERQGLVELTLRYGTTGRPEHRYRMARR
jgi:response regulator of citrate/malate metabolism